MYILFLNLLPVRTAHSTSGHMEVRVQFTGVGVLLPCGSRGLNSGSKTWWQAFLSTELFLWPCKACFKAYKTMTFNIDKVVPPSPLLIPHIPHR